jgi:hypothetical protein
MHRKRYTFKDFVAFMKRDSTVLCLIVVVTLGGQTKGWLW